MLLAMGSQSGALSYTRVRSELHSVTVHCSPLVAFSCPSLLNRLAVSPISLWGVCCIDSNKLMKHWQQGTVGMFERHRVWEKDRLRNVPVGKVIHNVWLTLKAPACFLILKTHCNLHISVAIIEQKNISFLLSAALVEELLKTPVVRVAGAVWSPWESWSTCSQSCAKGYRTRRRSCAGPEGKTAPIACRGSPVEYQDCNVQACPGEWRHQSPDCVHAYFRPVIRRPIPRPTLMPLLHLIIYNFFVTYSM